MPRAQRSRACQQCRERRVKCDETPQVCQQCHRLGLRCSGPLQGSVIIDMTDRAARPRPPRKREVRKIRAEGAKDVVVKTEPDTVEHASALPLAIPASIPTNRNQSLEQVQRNELESKEAIARIHRQFRLPALYQPSRAVPDALDMAFISHFVQNNNTTPSYNAEIPWLTHLPNLHGSASKPAVRLSIRATSMAFYAVVHRDTTILVDSFRWYTLSLACQRHSLAKMSAQSIPHAEEILVPLILSIYEAYAGTTTTSIWPHMDAAVKIIELRGPNRCTGLVSTLFKIFRVSDAHKAIFFNEPSIFSAPDWMTVPFEGQWKSAHQDLIDILLLLPETISTLGVGPGSMRHLFSQPISPKVNVEPVFARITKWLQELDDWAARFPYLTKAPAGEIITHDMANLATDMPVNAEVTLSNTFVAFTAASYEAIRLILLLLLHKVISHVSRSHADSTEPTANEDSLLVKATAASAAVLDIAAYMETSSPIGGFDVLRSVFPIVIVMNLGPRQQEKELAQETLMRWGQKRGITGLCSAFLNV